MTREQFYACFREMHALFHKHWTAAVGKPGYVKGHWRQLENELMRVWRDRATAIGIPGDAPLLATKKPHMTLLKDPNDREG